MNNDVSQQVQLEGWTHRFRDIDEHMMAKGYGEEAIGYFKACVCYLLSAKSKQSMHDRFRKEFECIWPRDFVQYYRGKLLPRSGKEGVVQGELQLSISSTFSYFQFPFSCKSVLHSFSLITGWRYDLKKRILAKKLLVKC